MRASDQEPSPIAAQAIPELLLAASPSFGATWDLIEDENRDLEAPHGRLHYLDAGCFARHIVDLHRNGRGEEVQRAFDLIERLLVEGDAYARELATIGYLEGIQIAAGHAGVDAVELTPYLHPESARWWKRLDRFWDGDRDSLADP